ncbi:MAG: hypothetical protein J6R79_04930 [Bacteroidaceae bacterium]|nr:hypothetical protein [Bacteroidaceae bacterium]
MTKEKNKQDFLLMRLKEYVENIAGFRMNTPRDFDFLSGAVLKETRTRLSPTTLRRLWGYQKEVQTSRLSTLNILSCYIGYSDWETFCKYQLDNGEVESEFLKNNSLNTSTLIKGDKLKLMWHPDRCVTIQYIGLSMFRVIENRNSKLSVDDTFICDCIIENQPLTLYNLIRKNSDPVNYICGKKGGVKYLIITG